MIKDFNEFHDEACITADVCIVGAGAAGITIAREFLSTRYTVVVLESGGLDTEAETQQLYQSEIVGLPHIGIHQGRVRTFGGTTTVWGGQSLRFGASDFQERSWIPDSGWPICRQKLDPYYDRADRVLQLGARIPYNDLCAASGIEPPAFDSTKLFMECSQWSRRPNFGTTYRGELRKANNISVLLHANVTEIITNQAATAVAHVEFRTLAGKRGTAKARFYVICCGAIETARLLLASDRIEQHGVGNEYGLVGSYFQEHILFWYHNLLTTYRPRLQQLFESFFLKGRKYAPLIALSERLQADKQLVHICGTVIFWHEPDSSIIAMKNLFRTVRGESLPPLGELKHLVGKALADPRELFGLAYRLYVQGRAGTPRRGPIYFAAMCEMAPNPTSRVMLGERRDQLGMRRARLDWRLGELERRTASECIRTIASEFEIGRAHV